MGTNYKLRKNICDKCNHSAEELHIGKSSCGWTFTFRAHDEPFIHSVEDWRKELPKGRIFNEYGEEISEDEFWEIVKAQKKLSHNHARENPSPNDWIDNDGNSFTRTEFS